MWLDCQLVVKFSQRLFEIHFNLYSFSKAVVAVIIFNPFVGLATK